MRKYRTLFTCIVLVIFNSTDIYSQNTDNTFGIFESLVGIKFDVGNQVGTTGNKLEFKLIDDGNTLTIIKDRGQYTHLKKTGNANQFTVEGIGFNNKKIKKSTARLTPEGVLQVEEKISNLSGVKTSYELKNRGIIKYINYLKDGYWGKQFIAGYFYFPDQVDEKRYQADREVGFLLDFGDFYTNDPNDFNGANYMKGLHDLYRLNYIKPFYEYYRVVVLKGRVLKIDFKTEGKTKVILFDSKGDIVYTIDPPYPYTIITFPIKKDDLYFVSVIRDDVSKEISLRFFLE